MAAGALDAGRAAALHKHLEGCPGCRQYWESMCALSERLNFTELPSAELPQTFHARLVRRIHDDERAPPILIWLAAVRRLFSGRRLVMGTVAALAIAMVIWVQNLGRDNKHTLVPVAVHTIGEAPTQRVMPPTLASYRLAANVSLENLDAVLATQVAPKRSTLETPMLSSLRARSLED